MMTVEQRAAAETLFDYLALRDPDVGSADLIVGFGHFDLRIPQLCGALWATGMAPRILFTGGIGAGTVDLSQPEAHTFRDEAFRRYPEIPASAILVEAASRHTGENVEKSMSLLNAVSPEACIARGIARVVLVATAARQRRVYLTCLKHWPHLKLTNLPPQTSYEDDRALFDERGRDLDELLLGEIDRLLAYPARGYIEQIELPAHILTAYRTLRDLRRPE